MAWSISKSADLVLRHLEMQGIDVDDYYKEVFKKTGFIDIEGYTCRVVNVTSETNMRVRVNKDWFSDDDNMDKPFIEKPGMTISFELNLIPTENKLYFLHFKDLRNCALQLEYDRDIWFKEAIWGIEIDIKNNCFRWKHNNKCFPLQEFSVNKVKKLPDYNKYAWPKDVGEIDSRKYVKTTRLVRDTSISKEVKEIYNYACQICGETIMLDEDNYYAEAHHLKPLGSPHYGPDKVQNVICVCPNHHAMLDYGALYLDKSRLYIHKNHDLKKEFLDYHNKIISYS
ncbi:HNH endonuclease [Natranaerobius trueperi]|uniref:HNH nuclease domain-containing protein n=1 Tax=Natranaerobius trueperi TaxID=759412 RepID=A0A226C0H5_9FIRM|nr:HNH endonuclease [Natranaerobius trueperi]OWZ84094.1 hypothetical protein CDO51_05105 [Natranaerobius trueperi]